MNTETHRQLANDIWSICNLLRGPYKRNEYRKVIAPNLNSYINGFSPNVRAIMERFAFDQQIAKMAEKHIRDLNSEANPLLYGQDWNDEAWAVCRADMLIKGEDADNIALGACRTFLVTH